MDFKIKNHCSDYDEHPKCNPPCNMVQFIELDGKKVESEWFNPHFADKRKSKYQKIWVEYNKDRSYQGGIV